MTAAAAAGLLMTASAALGASNDLIPGGSWIASCGNARTDGLTLVADCKRIDGSINTARLDMRQCESPPRADNINGELRCVGSREPMFPGSWNTSCIFETMHADGSVSASCFANNTIFLRTFKPKTCNQPAVIGFQGGELVCENGVQALAREVAPAPKVATSPPATRSITPTPAATPDPPPADDDPNRPFAGEWDIVTERGDRFRLTAEQTGNAFVGAVPFGDQRLQMNGVVGAEKKLTLVWQIGNLAGTGELSLNEDGKTLQGVLQTEGGPIEGGTWTGTRPGSGPVALPLGETSSTTSLPQATTQPGTAPTAADGFETATVASAVSIRDKPRAQSGSKTIGTLTAGTTVSVRCDKSWCELAEGRGWVWKDPLRFGAADSGSGGTTTVPKTTSAPANFAGTWQYTFSGANRALATYNCTQSGNAVQCSTSNDSFSGTASGRVFTASEGDATMRVTLDSSGSKLSGTTTRANGELIWNISGIRVGANTANAPVQRTIEPVPEQQDTTRFNAGSGVSLEQMLDGLFNRRTAD
jgi:hypothetical protein